MMKRAVWVVGAALLWPVLAQADFNYNYAQVGYVEGEIETGTIARKFVQRPVEDDYNGYALEASTEFKEHFLLQGEYTNFAVSGDEGSMVLGRAGLGAHMALSDTVDVYGTLNYETFSTYYADGGSGFGATVGLRWQSSDISEVQPFIGYVDYGDVDTETVPESNSLDGWRAGVRATFKINEDFAVSTDWRIYRLTLAQQNFADADVDLDKEAWLSLRYYW